MERLRFGEAVFGDIQGIGTQSAVIVDSDRENVLKYKILDSMIQERLNDV